MTDYTAVITLSSTDDSPEVNVKVVWEPSLVGEDVEELGYLPASFVVASEIIDNMLADMVQEELSKYAIN